MYDPMLGEIREMCGEISGQLQGVLREITRMADEQREITARVNKLEQGRAWLTGVTAAVSAMIASIVTLVGMLWGHK